MNRFLPMLLLAMITTACTGPSYMTWKPEKHTIWSVRPLPGKAAVVVARTTEIGSDIEFATFLDRKMIGATKGPGYFIKTNIEPGPHYIITRAEIMDTSDTAGGAKPAETSMAGNGKSAEGTKNGEAAMVENGVKIIENAKITEVAQLMFEPDTVYYLLQTPRIEARITVAPVTPEYLNREMDDNCTLLDYQQMNPVADLIDPEYRELTAGYQREIIEGMHTEFVMYRGTKIENNQPAPDRPIPKK